MDMNKAIRKQKKSYKRFMLTMCFIFFVLPLVLMVTGRLSWFYVLYLAIIEMLIVFAVLAKINHENLKFDYDNYRIKIKLGIRKDKINIICNKVVFVHVENIIRKTDKEKDFIIILIGSSRFRSKRMIPINEKFLRMHPYAAFHYQKIKTINPEKEYAFTIIRNGKLLKYELLDTIYKSCVYATFTEDAIDKIKEYRNSLLLK